MWAAASARTTGRSGWHFPRGAQRIAATPHPAGRKTARLRLKISFKGNAALSAGSATNTLVVRKQGAGAAHRGRDGAPSRPPRARYRLLATRPEEIDPWP